MSSYLKAFSTQAEYETYMAGSPLLPNVSLIGGLNVEYNRTPLTVGMICYYDGKKLKFCGSEDWPSNGSRTSTLGTAIGVVVVPSNHTPDGLARIVSLDSMYASNPDSGSTSNQTMPWGAYPVDAGLTKYTRVPTWDNTIGGTTGSYDNGYLPSDNTGANWSGATCACDSLTKYYGSISQYIPSLYLSGGTRNPNVDVVTSGGTNALTDFNGKLNTAKLCNKATAQADWRTASSIITTTGDTAYYPAACCCWRYHTVGTHQGDWYLPACGELAYFVPRFMVINASIAKVGGLQLPQSIFWSSSEYSANESDGVATGYGRVGRYLKNGSFSVRGFLSVTPKGKIK